MHVIERKTGDNRYILKNQYTGERTEVVVDPDKIDLFQDTRTFMDRPEACPFFRFDTGQNTGYCTVHATRPPICCEYGCFRILILNAKGERAGRVMEYRHLASHDPALMALFSENEEILASLPDREWDEAVIRMIRSAGYIVRM